MIYVLIFFLLILFFMFLLIFLRKFQYDKTHQALVDIVDEIGGEVIRNSFASQPIYSGSYEDKKVQITFSTDKIKNKRVDYITLSYVYPTLNHVTILSKDWLTQMELSDENSDLITKDFDKFIVRSDNQKAMNAFDANLAEDISELFPFAHIVFSPSGIMFERISTMILADIEKDSILKILARIHKIAKSLP